MVNLAEAQQKDIVELVERWGYRTRGSGNIKWCECPLPTHQHYNHTPSFSIYWYHGKQMWKCHGQCGLHGDVVDLIGFMQIPDYQKHDGKKYVEAARLLLGDLPEISRSSPPLAEPLLPNWLWEDFLPVAPNVRAYLHQRGLTDTEIEKFKLGSARWLEHNGKIQVVKNVKDALLSIPTFHFGSLWGIKLRKLDGKGNYRYFGVPGSRKGLFNLDAVYQASGPVLVVKGELAAMVCDRFGFLACAPTGGEGSYVEAISGALALAQPIIVGDNDPSPETRKKMTEAAYRRAAALGGIVKFPPEKYKDIDEWLLDDPNAPAEIRKWMSE